MLRWAMMMFGHSTPNDNQVNALWWGLTNYTKLVLTWTTCTTQQREKGSVMRMSSREMRVSRWEQMPGPSSHTATYSTVQYSTGPLLAHWHDNWTLHYNFHRGYFGVASITYRSVYNTMEKCSTPRLISQKIDKKDD